MNFEWTDELVREFFLDYRHKEGSYPISERMKEFKEEKIKDKELKEYTKDDLVRYCRDAVSETWCSSSFTSAQKHFDEFLLKRGLIKPSELKIKIQ